MIQTRHTTDTTSPDERLWRAAQFCDVRKMHRAVKAGADIHLEKNGKTVVDMVFDNQHSDERRGDALLLLSHEGFRFIPSPDTPGSLLLLRRAISGGLTDILKRLLANDAVDPDGSLRRRMVNHRLGQAFQVIHLVALSEATNAGELVDLVMEAGADVNSDSNAGSALRMAAQRGKLATVMALIRHGANKESAAGLAKGLVHSAVSGLNADVVRALHAEGWEIDEPDHVGFTPLIDACIVGCPEMVVALIELGADPACRTKDGRGVYDFAKNDKVLAVLRALTSRSALDKLLSTTRESRL